MPMPTLRLGALSLLTALTSSCIEATQVPVGGVYRATVQSQGGEGAALIELVGPGIEEIAAPGFIAAAHSSADTTRVLILVDPRNPPGAPPLSFLVTMADGTGVPRSRVLQVVGVNNRIRDFPQSHVVHFSRTEAP